jgi:hypothetical protein
VTHLRQRCWTSFSAATTPPPPFSTTFKPSSGSRGIFTARPTSSIRPTSASIRRTCCATENSSADGEAPCVGAPILLREDAEAAVSPRRHPLSEGAAPPTESCREKTNVSWPARSWRARSGAPTRRSATTTAAATAPACSARPTRASTVCPTRPTASAQRLDRLFECLEGVVRTCPECSKKKLPLGALLVHLNDAPWARERIAAWVADPTCRKTKHTPITDGSLPLTAIPRAARRTGRSVSRGARAAMPPSVPPPSAAA